MRIEHEYRGNKIVARKTAPGEILVCINKTPSKFKLNFTEEKTKLRGGGGPTEDQVRHFLELVAVNVFGGELT